MRTLPGNGSEGVPKLYYDHKYQPASDNVGRSTTRAHAASLLRPLYGVFGVVLLQSLSATFAAEPPAPTAVGGRGGETPGNQGAAPATAAGEATQAPPGSAGAKPPAPAASSAKQPTPAAPVRQFPILEYQIDGNTLLSVPEVERAVTPHLGESRSIKDIEAARAQLEKAYHDHGYRTVVVNIPQQRVSDGVVRLHVTEAPVGKLHIAGSRYHSLQVIRDKVAQLNEGQVPDFGEVQKELADVNRSADLRVTPVLKASETPGRVDVDLDVTDTLPFHATLEANNRYSADTTKLRTIGELRYDNLFQRGQSISAQYQIAPERASDAEIASFSYVIPMRDNLVWALYAVHSDSNIAAVGDLNVIGKGNIYGVRLISPLPTDDRSFYHSLTAGVDYKDFQQSVVVQSAGSSVESPASYPAFSLQYSGTWLGDAPSGNHMAATSGGRSSTTLDAGIEFLVRGLGTDRQQFADKRAGAGPSFFIFRPGLQREQLLPGAWSLVGKVDGQVASGPLINNEEYAAGGADSVRGYTEAERLADNGVRGSVELRTPQLLAHTFAHVERSYLLLFAEGAHLRVIDALPGQENVYTLASAGLGLRFKAAGLTINLDGARILKDGSVTLAGRYRGLFQVIYTH